MDQREAKAQLRAEMKALRTGLKPEEVDRLARLAADRVRMTVEWRQAETVCLYAAIRQELGTAPLLQAALAEGKSLMLPRVRPDGTLGLHRVTNLATLPLSPLGILEPAASSPEAPPTAVDFFLVPGLAFDAAGHRLGYGAGFYDRLLAHTRTGAFTVGYGYEFQLRPEIPTEAHDQALQAIAMPDRILRTGTV